MRDGLIAMAPGKDRRLRVLALTAKGLDLVEKATPFWARTQQSIIEGLGAARWQELIAHLSATTEVTKGVHAAGGDSLEAT